MQSTLLEQKVQKIQVSSAYQDLHCRGNEIISTRSVSKTQGQVQYATKVSTIRNTLKH